LKVTPPAITATSRYVWSLQNDTETTFNVDAVTALFNVKCFLRHLKLQADTFAVISVNGVNIVITVWLSETLPQITH